MKFKVLELNAFGKFQDYRLELPDGIVVLEGDNESGKTTLFHFVLLMFYGNAGAERSNDIQKSLRKKYMPWKSAAVMSGAVEMEYDGMDYRIEKVFRQSWLTDEVTIYNRTTGERFTPKKQQEVGEYFFQFGAETFLKTILLGEHDHLSRTDGKGELVWHLSNLAVSGEEELSAHLAQERLEAWRQRLVSKRGDRGQLSECRARERRLESQLEQLCDRLDEYEGVVGRQEPEPLHGEAHAGVFHVVITALAVVCAAAGVWAGAAVAWPGYLFAAVAAGCYVGYCRLRAGQKKLLAARNAAQTQEYQRQMTFLKQQFEQLQSQKESLAKELKECTVQRGQLEETYEALSLAKQAVAEASKEFEQDYTPKLMALTAEYLSNLTRGKYTDLIVTPELSVYIREHDTESYHEWKYLSYATVCQAYLSLRLSILDLLDESGEDFPLVCDDVFSSYDEERLEDAQAFLYDYAARRSKQVLFFTCHPHMFCQSQVTRVRITDANTWKM